MLAHEVSTRSTIHPMDLSKMPLDQISACSAILGVPDGARIIGHLVVVGVFDFLLEPELFQDIKVDKAGLYFSPQRLGCLRAKHMPIISSGD